ncbi:MAG TPA: ABC transporter ATP-binding protein [Chloroflexota bacterium]|nr:ABC transporter ATP-binding protein [Chloroflexota bacterium]
MALIEVEDLRTYLYTHRGVNRAVDGVSFSLDAGQSLGLVGESGSGKSMTALSILRLVPQPIGRIVSGSIRFNGSDLLQLPDAEMRRLRGRDISIILQDPLTSLNPLFTIGFQIGEAVGLHQKLTGRAQLDEAIRSLRQVRVAAAEVRVNDYPHQFSGGMRQRVVGAIAIACKPQLLIADEATTALDATIQAQYLALLRDLQRELNLAVLFITHDFGIVAKMCDYVAVMYAGRIVEYADVREIFNRPAHPYTQALLRAVPKVDSRIERLYAIPGVPATGHAEFAGCPFAPRCPAVIDKCRHERPPAVSLPAGHMAECWRAEEVYAGALASTSLSGPAMPGVNEKARPLVVDPLPDLIPAPAARSAVADSTEAIITAEDLRVYFPVQRGPVFRRQTVLLKAVDGVSFQIGPSQTFSLVGESGCGKTTTARALLSLESPTAGAVRWLGKDVSSLGAEELRAYRAGVQAVFQDPYSSMNPRMRVGDFVAEPLSLNPSLTANDRRDRVADGLRRVGLRAEDAQLFPHQFSGGQRQRLAIARALVSSPRVIVLDEPVSSLDVSIRAQIMNLLKELQAELGLSYLFIAHHLGTVRYMSDTVAVMYLGRIVELAPAEEIFSNPLHPYTRALLSAALPDHPDLLRDEVLLKGDVAAATDIPAGCRLHPRCPFALPECAEIEPAWRELASDHWAACHLY